MDIDELGKELPDQQVDPFPDYPGPGQVHHGRVFGLLIKIPLARIDRVRVPTSHRDHNVGGSHLHWTAMVGCD